MFCLTRYFVLLYFEGEKIVNKAESEALGTQGKAVLSFIRSFIAHMKTLFSAMISFSLSLSFLNGYNPTQPKLLQFIG